MLSRFVWRDGRFRDPRTNEPMPMPERDGVCMPRIYSDIEDYRSPIDGKLISSRSQRRYDLESNGCLESDPPAKKRGYRNPTFALKRSLPLNEEAQEKWESRDK